MAVTQRRMTLEEFLELPEIDEKPYLELVDGVVRQKQNMAPQWRHGLLQPALATTINQHAWPRKLAVAFTEIREAFGRDSLIPDIGVYRWDRVPRSAVGEVTNGPPTPPDIAIEIRSPGQRVAELVAKGRRYLAHGAGLALVVDPDGRTVVRMCADGSMTTLQGQDRIDLSPLLPELELTVQALFELLLTE